MKSLANTLQTLIFSKTAKAATIVLFGNATSSILAVIFTIIAARALGPESWGLVAAVGSFLTILVALGELGMDAGLLKFVSKHWKEGEYKKAKSIFEVVFTVRIILGLIITLLLATFGSPLAQLIFNSKDTSLVYFSALGFLAALVLDYQIASTQAKQHWKVAAILLALTNAVRIVGIIVLALLGAITQVSVLYVFTTAGLVGYIISLFWHRTNIGLRGNWKQTLGALLPFSGWMGLNKIVSVFNSRVDVLLLINLASPHGAGVYAAANRLAMGVPIVIASFATVLAPKLAGFKTKEEVKVYFRKSLGLTTIIVTGLIFGIFIAPIVTMLFGDEYEGATGVLQLLFVSFIPFAFTTPAVNTLIYAFKRPQIIALTTLAQSPIVLISNFYLIPKIGIFAPVLTIGLVNTSTLLISYYFVWKYFNETSKKLS